MRRGKKGMQEKIKDDETEQHKTVHVGGCSGVLAESRVT